MRNIVSCQNLKCVQQVLTMLFGQGTYYVFPGYWQYSVESTPGHWENNIFNKADPPWGVFIRFISISYSINSAWVLNWTFVCLTITFENKSGATNFYRATGFLWSKTHYRWRGLTTRQRVPPYNNIESFGWHVLMTFWLFFEQRVFTVHRTCRVCVCRTFSCEHVLTCIISNQQKRVRRRFRPGKMAIIRPTIILQIQFLRPYPLPGIKCCTHGT